MVFFSINLFYNFNEIINSQPKSRDCNLLIIGDSHPQKALNPKFFKSADNVSLASEPIVLTYWKLEALFETSNPDTVIIGFSFHNIAKYNDFKFSDKRWASEMFKRSYTIQEFNSIDSLINIEYETLLNVLWHEKLAFYPMNNHIRYLGSYNNNDQSNLSNLKRTLDKHYFNYMGNNEISELSITYLDSIIDFTHKKKAIPILVSTLVHPKYLDAVPDYIKQEFCKTLDNVKPKALVYKMEGYQLPDSYYLEFDYLNSNGADRFTKKLLNDLSFNGKYLNDQ